MVQRLRRGAPSIPPRHVTGTTRHAPRARLPGQPVGPPHLSHRRTAGTARALRAGGPPTHPRRRPHRRARRKRPVLRRRYACPAFVGDSGHTIDPVPAGRSAHGTVLSGLCSGRGKDPSHQRGGVESSHLKCHRLPRADPHWLWADAGLSNHCRCSVRRPWRPPVDRESRVHLHPAGQATMGRFLAEVAAAEYR